MQRKLNSLIGQNLLLIKRRGIEEIINENKLISEYTVVKQYPNKISCQIEGSCFGCKVYKR
jgi:cell division septal protein FtsQ